MNTNTIHHFNEFIIRIPALPFERIETLLKEDHTEDEVLKEYFQLKPFLEGLSYASPSLYDSMKKWLEGRDLPAKKKLMLRRKGLEYLIRMSTRCTPFGLFAGVATGAWESNNQVVLDNQKQIHVRYDMGFCLHLASLAEKDKILKDKLVFYPNSSIYKAFSELRYIHETDSKDITKIKVNSIEKSEFLESFLDFCREGRRLTEIYEYQYNTMPDEDLPDRYINSLINHKIIVSELEPNVTGKPYFNRLKKTIEALSGIQDDQYRYLPPKLDGLLRELQTSLAGKNHLSVQEARNIAISELTGYSLNKVFHIDLFHITRQCTLDRQQFEPLKHGLETLIRLYPRRESAYLARFKKEFRYIFGNREVPLMQALDPESGIMTTKDRTLNSYFTVSDILTETVMREPEHSLRLSVTDLFLLKKVQEAYMLGQCRIDIGQEEIPGAVNLSFLPDTFNIVFTILEEKQANSEKIYLKGLSGPSASHLLSRFAVHNDELERLLQKIIKHEKHDENSLCAELVYYPGGTGANLCIRPGLRDFEIPFLAMPSAGNSHKLTLNDLTVRIENDEIMLRSLKHNKPVKVFSSHSLDYTHAELPVFRFLHELQSQFHYDGLTFDWGPLTELFPCLPRVVAGNVILAPRSWRFRKEDLLHLSGNKPKTALKKAITRWRYKHKMPSRVFLDENGKEIFINLNSLNGINLFLFLTANKKNVCIKEFLQPDSRMVTGKDGNYLHEIIAPCRMHHETLKKVSE